MVPTREKSIVVQGFEIHSGQTRVVVNHDNVDEARDNSGSPLLRWEDDKDDGTDGWISGAVAGTYLHGILECRAFRSWFFLGDDDIDRNEEKCTGEPVVDPLDRLADHLSAHGLDCHTLSRMIGLEPD